MAAHHACAFALLGPFEPWMDVTNSLRLPGDIGGALDITEEYRWNVPVVTYGFDQTFLDYFGSNGLAAVEQAIQILNDLPPASSLVLTNFPFAPLSYNYAAQAQGLHDLKSATLTALVEQLGLAEPTRHVFDLRRWADFFLWASEESTWWPDLFLYFILERNFDPETFETSHYVNGTLFSGYIEAFPPVNPYPPLAGIQEFSVDPLANTFTAVRDNPIFNAGEFASGLSRDDAGGLRYLLRSNNLNFEMLLDDVRGAGTNAGSVVNTALRPGVQKITFVQHPFDSLLGRFLPFTNQYTDTYISNGFVLHQQLERVATQPDFLFSAADTGEGEFYAPLYTRSGTSNWCNNAALNGDPTKAGPGVIQPPVRITFHKEGHRKYSSDGYENAETAYEYGEPWGSFDNSTNPPIAHPVSSPPDAELMTVRLRLFRLPYSSFTNGVSYTWQTPVPYGSEAVLQSATNLTSWVTLATVTNRGGVIEWQHNWAKPQRFFRVVPQ